VYAENERYKLIREGRIQEFYQEFDKTPADEQEQELRLMLAQCFHPDPE